MSFWDRFRRKAPAAPSDERLQRVRLDLPGWHEEIGDPGTRLWRNVQGDVIALVIMADPETLPDFSSESAVRQWSRSFAEERGDGLIEAGVDSGMLRLIFKRLETPAYLFVGMLILQDNDGWLLWTAIGREGRVTGVREAVITDELLRTGKLTVESYERSWAQDPFDSDYRGVDRSVLRFLSDDECYDERFPDHPLTRVRKILSILPGALQATAGAGSA